MAQKEIKDLKKLNASELKKQAKKLDDKGEMTVEIGGQEFKLTFDTHFRKTKIQHLLEDMLNFFNEINNDKIGMLEFASPYTALLILKHFTSLDVSDNVSEAFALLEVLIDLEVLGELVGKLPEDEVVKVYEILTKTVENVSENLEDTESELEKIKGQVSNEIVKEMIDGDGIN